ncbi:hypothetical protein A1F99_023000 [Pyrenophora tritici-repentis]|nr:hypothetical protein A1F99_023000 [Pyrenophora tritici-repentis]
MAEASKQQVLTTVKGLLESGAYSDFVITCGADTHKVHKAIVCTQVDFFAHALEFGGKTDFVCEECDPSLAYVPLNGTSDQLLLHAKMYEITDKYNVVGLKDLVVEKFSRACKNFWDDDNFPVAAHHAFSTAPEDDMDLRSIVSATIDAHIELVDKFAVIDLMLDFSELGVGVLRKKVKDHG